MAKDKKNLVLRIQDFISSYKGKVFMNYVYNWGAAVVIAGTLFKLTHLPGANLMIWIGMGTEVLVFFISAFELPRRDIVTPVTTGGVIASGGAPLQPGEEEALLKAAAQAGNAGGGQAVGGGGVIIVGGSAPMAGAPVTGVTGTAITDTRYSQPASRRIRRIWTDHTGWHTDWVHSDWRCRHTAGRRYSVGRTYRRNGDQHAGIH